MNRRTVLTAAVSAPAVALAGSLPVVAALETPVMALFRQWKAHNAWLNSDATAGMTNDEFDAVCLDDMDIVRRMIVAPTHDVQDLCAKLIAVTDFGTHISYIDLDGADRLTKEARALVA